MLDKFISYYNKAKMMQELKFEGGNWTEQDVDDPLIWNIPIYDVVNRKYAAFSSLLEAISKRENDPKGNGKHFKDLNINSEDFVKLCYLFRLCGSGINYIPKTEDPWGTHGFGNFWVIDFLRQNKSDPKEWIDYIPDKKFCDVKGYLLPMIKGGLKNFIEKNSMNLVDHMTQYMQSHELVCIKDFVDEGNSWLMNRGFKRQNFVLTAFAMDMAEYFPTLVDRDSDVYVGSNAKKCLKQIMPGVKHDKALRDLCKLTGGYSKPYDMEDVACDFIRYMDNFQSVDHIKNNDNIIYKNNV